MEQKTAALYERWCREATLDSDLSHELAAMRGNDTAIEDAFFRELTFGTGGLRGVIGAGTNRMNVYTVARASQGLANYVLAHFEGADRRIAVSYDSRIKSALFARVSAAVFAANGIAVSIWPQLMPTPCLSFAVRELGCAAGIMVTASHNPGKYNGYKAYGADGCQITAEAADEILANIMKLDEFIDVKFGDYEQARREGLITDIGEEVYTAFIERVKGESMLSPDEKIDRDVAIVYTPLNGTGLRPVCRILRECGFGNITVVPEQEMPDGRFPTCPYPDPEIREAMGLGIRLASEKKADLLLATDPDCDRVGIAVRDAAGEYVLLSGNETGMLLLDYICARHRENGTMPENPVFVKTVVTTDMAERIATYYGVRTVNVLTGFKFIGEQIALLEAAGRADSYILGFEESYGYLSGSYVRDKDAVNASLLVCEMFAYYATRGITLLDKLNELYGRFGFCQNTLHNYVFEGAAGFAHMQSVMRGLRADIRSFGGKAVRAVLDYAPGLDGLPPSDVIKFLLEDNCSLVVRPSGTEPKIKAYISVSTPKREDAAAIEKAIADDLAAYLK